MAALICRIPIAEGIGIDGCEFRACAFYSLHEIQQSLIIWKQQLERLLDQFAKTRQLVVIDELSLNVVDLPKRGEASGAVDDVL